MNLLHSTSSRPKARPSPTPTDVMRRVYAEFRELHGSPLSLTQAARLFGLDRGHCQTILEGLIGQGLLARDAHGRYCLAEIGV